MNENKIDTLDVKSKSRFSDKKRDRLEKPSTELNNLSINDEVVFLYVLWIVKKKMLDFLKLNNFKG